MPFIVPIARARIAGNAEQNEQAYKSIRFHSYVAPAKLSESLPRSCQSEESVLIEAAALGKCRQAEKRLPASGCSFSDFPVIGNNRPLPAPFGRRDWVLCSPSRVLAIHPTKSDDATNLTVGISAETRRTGCTVMVSSEGDFPPSAYESAQRPALHHREIQRFTQFVTLLSPSNL